MTSQATPSQRGTIKHFGDGTSLANLTISPQCAGARNVDDLVEEILVGHKGISNKNKGDSETWLRAQKAHHSIKEALAEKGWKSQTAQFSASQTIGQFFAQGTHGLAETAPVLPASHVAKSTVGPAATLLPGTWWKTLTPETLAGLIVDSYASTFAESYVDRMTQLLVAREGWHVPEKHSPDSPLAAMSSALAGRTQERARLLTAGVGRFFRAGAGGDGDGDGDGDGGDASVGVGLGVGAGGGGSSSSSSSKGRGKPGGGSIGLSTSSSAPVLGPFRGSTRPRAALGPWRTRLDRPDLTVGKSRQDGFLQSRISAGKAWSVASYNASPPSPDRNWRAHLTSPEAKEAVQRAKQRAAQEETENLQKFVWPMTATNFPEYWEELTSRKPITSRGPGRMGLEASFRSFNSAMTASAYNNGSGDQWYLKTGEDGKTQFPYSLALHKAFLRSQSDEKTREKAMELAPIRFTRSLAG